MNLNEKYKGWYCEKCGAGYGEYIACEEPDCGPLIFVPPMRRPLKPPARPTR